MLSFSEACERNKEPILEVLRGAFAHRVKVLEIGSGTGQHAVHFAAHLSHLSWFPTERPAFLNDLIARVKIEGPPNLHLPMVLDVKQTVWPVRNVDAAFTANTLHIMAWAEVIAFFRGLAPLLSTGGVLCVYGPFRDQGRCTSKSNEQFDCMLRKRDPLSGLRDMGDITALGTECGLELLADHDLPANNRLLQFQRI